MELIYTNKARNDIGVLNDYELDLSYGKEENTFSLSLALDKHCLTENNFIYLVNPEYGAEDATEYGGIVDSIKVNTDSNTVTYSGRTWHGIIEKRVICPPIGQDYKVVSGDAHAVIREIIAAIGLSSYCTAPLQEAGINIKAYKFNRYCNAYEGLTDMLAAHNAKLKARFVNKKIQLEAVLIADYSKSEEWDNSQVDFEIEKNYKPVNHLICLGGGDLRNRKVIHIFADKSGEIQPYATAEMPVKDSDYILDKSKQKLFGLDEIIEVYDYPNAEATENYIKLSSTPSDWAYNYSAYYQQTANGEYESVSDSEQEQYSLLTSAPSDWATKYANYYIKSGTTYTSVNGVDTEKYTRLTDKPIDWATNWKDYFHDVSDGVTTIKQAIPSDTYTWYVIQTEKPTDWETNATAYYWYGQKKETVTTSGTTKTKLVKGKGYYSVSEYVDETKETTLDANGDPVADSAPTWKAKTFYTKYTKDIAPDFYKLYDTSSMYIYSKTTTAPAYAANTYYTKGVVTVRPTFKANTYYKMVIDNYAVMVAYALEHMAEYYSNSNAIDIDLNLLGEYDVGDIVGAKEHTTGLEVWQKITQKTVKIYKNTKTISYTIGDISL